MILKLREATPCLLIYLCIVLLDVPTIHRNLSLDELNNMHELSNYSRYDASKRVKPFKLDDGGLGNKEIKGDTNKNELTIGDSTRQEEKKQGEILEGGKVDEKEVEVVVEKNNKIIQQEDRIQGEMSFQLFKDYLYSG